LSTPYIMGRIALQHSMDKLFSADLKASPWCIDATKCLFTTSNGEGKIRSFSCRGVQFWVTFVTAVSAPIHYSNARDRSFAGKKILYFPETSVYGKKDPFFPQVPSPRTPQKLLNGKQPHIQPLYGTPTSFLRVFTL
jgi:hypothetical protein